MAAYVIVDIEVTDPAGFHEYLNVAGPIVAKYGGRLLAASRPFPSASSSSGRHRSNRAGPASACQRRTSG